MHRKHNGFTHFYRITVLQSYFSVWTQKHRLINFPFFFSLVWTVTKNQILNKKCQTKFLCVISIQKEKKTALPFLFLNWNKKKKIGWHFVFSTYLVFSHRPFQWKEQGKNIFCLDFDWVIRQMGLSRFLYVHPPLNVLLSTNQTIFTWWVWKIISNKLSTLQHDSTCY